MSLDKLTENETEEIFETNSYIPKSDDIVKLDDLIEMKNHFRLFDYCLDIIEFHYHFLCFHPFGDMNESLVKNKLVFSN